MRAAYEEARRELEGGGSCSSDSSSEIELELDVVPPEQERAVELVVQATQEVEMVGTVGELLAGHVTRAKQGAETIEGEGLEGGAQTSLPSVLHQMWEALKVRAYIEVLARELQPEVDLLHEVEADWAMLAVVQRRSSPGGDGGTGCSITWIQIKAPAQLRVSHCWVRQLLSSLSFLLFPDVSPFSTRSGIASVEATTIRLCSRPGVPHPSTCTIHHLCGLHPNACH